MKKHTIFLSSIIMGVLITLSFNTSQPGDVRNVLLTQAGEKPEIKTETNLRPAIGVIEAGKIEIVDKEFVLKAKGKKKFKLEGKELENYVGKEVKVKGLLIYGTNTIIVSEVEPSE